MTKWLALLAATVLAGPAAAQDAAKPADDPRPAAAGEARADFVNAEGASVGTATLMDTPHGVLIRVEIEGLTPGLHGFHIHETGACDAGGGFQSAGGHYNPADAEHGFLVDGGPHPGDMANQTVGEDGRLSVEVFNPMVRLDSGDAPLFDDDGSALMVHSGADDYRSQPAGDAGDRVACAVIAR